MALREKKDVLASIKATVRKIKGVAYTTYSAFCGSNAFTKKPIRVYSSDMKKLVKKVNDVYDEHKDLGDLASALTAEEVMDARLAIAKLRNARLTISLTECACREIERFAAISAHDKPIGEAWDEFFNAKPEGEDKNKAERTSGKWVMMVGEDTMLSSVTTKDIVEYLKTNYGSMAPKTYNSHLGYIKTFLNWCCKDEQRYLTENPAKNIPMKQIEWKEPKYMKPDTVERIFRALEKVKDSHPEYLAFAINGFFCGIRRAESGRMAEDDDAAKVHLDDSTVRIAKGKGFTNGRRPRAFTVPDNALAWMRSFDYESAIRAVRPCTLQNVMRYLDAQGIKWFHNAPRHTFITMHVAAYGDPAKTQAMVGTSGTMLCNNYRGLASRKEGEAYFSIIPSRTDPASST